MKTGKYLNLGTYQNIRIGYGTINYKELKTIYLSLKSWVMPTSEDDEDYDIILSRTRKKIKSYLYDSNPELFQKESIVDINIKSNRIKPNKLTFMDTEVTLFTKDKFDLKDEQIKKIIEGLIRDVIDIGFDNKNLYNFYENKKIVN